MGRCGRPRRGGIGGGRARGGALPAGAARRASAAHAAFALCIPLAAVLAVAAAASAGFVAAPPPPAWADAAAGGMDGGGAPAPAATHVAVPQGTVLGAGSPAPALASSLLAPGAAAANSTHMFVVDAGNGSGGGGGRVLAFGIGSGPADMWTLEAAIAVRGSPHGIAVNGTGHLFVSDPASGSVAVIGPGGERAGELRVPENARAAGAGAGTMDWPAGAAAAQDGRIYIAERNAGRVLVFGAGGEYLESIPRAGSAVRLLAPHGVAAGAASGEVYVADAAADAVHVFGAGGEHTRRIGVPPLDGARGSPHGVAVDPRSGALYVASLLQGALHSYDSSGAPAGAPVPLSPRQGAAPDGAPLPPRLLSVAARGDGLLLVTDAANGRAVLAHPNGTVHSEVAGSAAGMPPFAPADAAAGPGGAAYVADAAAGTVTSYGPVPPSGSRPHLWTSGSSVPAPAGIAVDADAGRVLVAHRGGSGGVAVSMLSAGDGSSAGVLYEGGGPGRPAGVDVGPGGAVAVADPSAGAVRLVAADGAQLGQIAGLDDPVDAAFMSDGSLVVAERGAHAVRVFGAGSWERGAAGAAAVAVASFGLAPGGVFMPEAVAIDGGDRIAVADAGGTAAFGPRVQVFDYAGRLVSQFDRDGGTIGAAPMRAVPYGAPYGIGAAPGGPILLAGPSAAADAGGGAVRTFASLDSEAPAVESFGMFRGGGTSPVPLAAGGAAHALGPYSQIAANVTFTEPVVVRTAPPAAGGASAGLPPTLALGIAGGRAGAPLASAEFCGPGNGTAEYGSGSGTASLLFQYTVLPGESAPALDYASEHPLDSRGSSITDPAGNRADLSMPAAPGGPGSFSDAAAAAAAGGNVAVNGSAGAFVDVGLLAANATAADSRAAALAACDFNRERASARDPGAGAAAAGPFILLAAAEAPGALDVEASGGWADRRAALAIAALRESRGAGPGPAAYVATLPDEVLATPVGPLQNSTVLGHAAGMGAMLVATAASSAPSLPAGTGGEMLYRLAPGGEHLAYALSAAIGPEIDVLFPIIQSDAFGEPAPARSGAAPFSHGLYGIVLGHLRDAGGIVNGFDAGALNYDRTRRAEFNFTAPHAGWAADAAELDLNLALLKGQVGDNRVAVLYLGSAAEYVEIAEAAASAPGGLPSLSGTRWLAAGGVVASPLVEASPAAAALAASTGLDAVAFGVGGGGVGSRGGAGSSLEGYDATPAALRVDALVGPGQGGAARAYSAYDAVQVVGRAAALAAERAGGANGTDASAYAAPSAPEISRHMGDAALAYEGALGNVRLDAATGYLGLPITYDVWRMDAEAGAWLRAHAERGIDTCSMSLASPDLDFGPVKARAASDPVRQSMANAGTLDLARIALGPGEWDTGTGGAVPALPATLTEYVDELSAPAARFAAVSGDPSKPTLVARGLEPAAEAGLLLRLNLRAVQSIDGMGEMSQAIEYTASCDR